MRRLAIGILMASAAFAQAGHWEGKIKMGENRDVALAVDLARNDKGAWVGSMSIPGSTSQDVPIKVNVTAETVQFTANLPQQATFDGKLSADGKTLSGTAKNAEGETTFQLTRTGEASVKTAPASTALAKEFEGEWEATIDSGGRVRKVGLRLANKDGVGTATLIAGEQKMEIPASTVTQTGKDLALDVRVVSGSFRGTLRDNGQIAGEWSEPSQKMPVTFTRVK